MTEVLELDLNNPDHVLALVTQMKVSKMTRIDGKNESDDPVVYSLDEDEGELLVSTYQSNGFKRTEVFNVSTGEMDEVLFDKES